MMIGRCILKLFLPLATVCKSILHSITCIGWSHSPGPPKSALVLACGHFIGPGLWTLHWFWIVDTVCRLWAERYGEAECWRCCVVLDPLAEIQRKVDLESSVAKLLATSGRRLHLEVWKPTGCMFVIVERAEPLTFRSSATAWKEFSSSWATLTSPWYMKLSTDWSSLNPTPLR